MTRIIYLPLNPIASDPRWVIVSDELIKTLLQLDLIQPIVINYRAREGKEEAVLNVLSDHI